MRRLLYNINRNVHHTPRLTHIVPRTLPIVTMKHLTPRPRYYADAIATVIKLSEDRYANELKARSQRVFEWINYLNNGLDNEKNSLVTYNVKRDKTGYNTVSFKMAIEPLNFEKSLELKKHVMPQLHSNDVVHSEFSLTKVKSADSGTFVMDYLEGTVKLYD
jgi:hypothetical protein